MSDSTIARVEAIALDEGQPLIPDSGLVVERRPDHPIDDSEYDRDYTPTDYPPPDPFPDDVYDPIDDHELNDLFSDVAAPFVLPDAHHPVVQGAPPANDHDNNNKHNNAFDDDHDETAHHEYTVDAINYTLDTIAEDNDGDDGEDTNT